MEIQQLLIGLMGGGLVALIPVIVKAVKDLTSGRMVKEETVIARWKKIADEKEEDAEKAWRMVNAFRKWYHPLWIAYVRVSQDDSTFPADPVQFEKKLRKEDDGGTT